MFPAALNPPKLSALIPSILHGRSAKMNRFGSTEDKACLHPKNLAFALRLPQPDTFTWEEREPRSSTGSTPGAGQHLQWIVLDLRRLGESHRPDSHERNV